MHGCICWSSLSSPSVEKYVIILTTESDICLIAYLKLWLRGFYITIVNLQIPVYHMYAFMPTELPELFLFPLSLSISCKKQPHLGLHKDPRCAARLEFYEMQPLSSSIREMGGWFGTLVLKYICVTWGKEIAQDCTLSLSLTHADTRTHTHG